MPIGLAPRDIKRARLATKADRVDYEYYEYRLDPVGWVERKLGESIWSAQREILEALVLHNRIAVPSAHGAGKSHIAARAIAWFASVHDPSTVKIITTSTTFRQVRTILWPYIRRVHSRHNLRGTTNRVEWHVGDDIVAFGFKSEDGNEEAAQGSHAPHMLIVVDEAGGISDEMGRAFTGQLTGSDTTILAIGNPPMDRDRSWFRSICESELWHVIRIAAFDTPNFTGEDVGNCASCPAAVPAHLFSDHLVDSKWVEEVETEYGQDSPYYIARVLAEFVDVVTNRLIPFSAIEAACECEVEPLHPVTLGIDPAGGGGDRFAIARSEGPITRVVHSVAGQANANAMDVSGVCLTHILAAEALAKSLGQTDPVQVKIDDIGLGFGIRDILKAWGSEQRHGARIIGVGAGSTASDPSRWANVRAEMWDNLRAEIVAGERRLEIPRSAMADLSGPERGWTSSGAMKLESKDHMKARGIRSPDEGDAIALSLYVPPGANAKFYDAS